LILLNSKFFDLGIIIEGADFDRLIRPKGGIILIAFLAISLFLLNELLFIPPLENFCFELVFFNIGDEKDDNNREELNFRIDSSIAVE
jgi:hypothetical protein